MSSWSARLRAGAWTRRALRQARRELKSRPLTEVAIEPPRGIPAAGASGVRVALRLSRYSCLEAALVRQRWDAEHGSPRDVVIGVPRPSERDEREAHAWLDGDDDPRRNELTEITRLAP
jgi:hypothetical protein